MGDILTRKVDFAIVTRDRDLEDDAPFESVIVDEWNSIGHTPVYYASPKMFAAPAIERTLNSYDVLYLNSFFSLKGSIGPYFKFRRQIRILIAPRGEFSKGALALKSTKKRVCLRLTRLFALYCDVQWHASTENEAADIERVFPNARIHIAPDPVVLGMTPPQTAKKQSGDLNIAFISRISPMKNLDYLLSVLARVKGSVRLNVYGPTEDTAYWERCMGLARQLPAGIDMQYCGELKAEEVSDTFARHDLFAFPTHGENFGHVIFEALRAGTPVLLSDRTPWKPNSTDALATVPLESSESWVAALQEALERGSAQQETARLAAREYARNYVAKSDTEGQNIRMFERVAAMPAV